MANFKMNKNGAGKVLVECLNCKRKEQVLNAVLEFWTCYCGCTEYKVVKY